MRWTGQMSKSSQSGVCAAGATPSVTQRVLHLHQQLVRRERPPPPVECPQERVADQKLVQQVVVVDDEEIAEWMEGPAQPGVRAERPRLVVVLHEAGELEVRRHVDT